MPINASWSADLFGNLLSSKRSAQVALLQSKDYQVSVQTNLIANIANMYYSLLMLDKQLEIVNDMEGLTKNTWDIMKLQKNSVIGVRSTAVQRAEASYYSVLTQKTDIKRQIRETVVLALECEGFAACEAATAARAGEQVAQRKPDVIILDLGLPDRDGVDFIRDLRAYSGFSSIKKEKPLPLV
jgi:CheY-like chemotaxis protein